MKSLDELLKSLGHAGQISPFKAGASYFSAMDWLLYLAEDVPYRADAMIPGLIDVLWHPYEDRIVGIKIWDASKHAAGQRILRTTGFMP